ncbi:hypothetical protein MHK_003725 [Candidatus Magnetomorum sp. HK-1]|nr:hypothetical protein MHK_003725 [Candidatus Magnetomorum sp. HK-1]
MTEDKKQNTEDIQTDNNSRGRNKKQDDKKIQNNAFMGLDVQPDTSILPEIRKNKYGGKIKLPKNSFDFDEDYFMWLLEHSLSIKNTWRDYIGDPIIDPKTGKPSGKIMDEKYAQNHTFGKIDIIEQFKATHPKFIGNPK